MSKQGVLLVNLGSPDSPSVRDVRKYLREFLMDGRVLDAPYLIRFCIVHFAILPSRPKQSAEAYQKIWLPEGSPLVVTSRKVQLHLQQRLDFAVELAMRYQNPSIDNAVRSLRAQGVTELLLIPLFPHYAMSSFETVVERVKQVMDRYAPQMSLQVAPPYYDQPYYVEALVASASSYLKNNYDHLLFSFHGLPERHLRKSDPTCDHCLRVEQCCDIASRAHPTCYRMQCFKTAEAFVKRAGVIRYSVALDRKSTRLNSSH